MVVVEHFHQGEFDVIREKKFDAIGCENFLIRNQHTK